MSKRLKELVEKIKYLSEYKTVEAVAGSIGYTRAHLTKEMKDEKESDLEKLLMEKHKDILQKESNITNRQDPPPQDKAVIALVESNKDVSEGIKFISKTNYELTLLLKQTVGASTKNLQEREPTFLEAYHTLLVAGVKEGRWESTELGQDILDSVLRETLRKRS
jgi:hypothetical protein